LEQTTQLSIGPINTELFIYVPETIIFPLFVKTGANFKKWILKFKIYLKKQFFLQTAKTPNEY
jgi:hypothetical protein